MLAACEASLRKLKIKGRQPFKGFTMRLPSLKRRIVGVPLLAVGIGLALVYNDLILAERLEALAYLLVIYAGCEVLFAGYRGKQRSKSRDEHNHRGGHRRRTTGARKDDQARS